MQKPRMERDPCPDRIVDDVGMGFSVGATGGSAYHFLQGLRNSPKGARIYGGMEAARMNVPRLAGSFAVWAGVFSACDCALVYARKKEDPYNPIIAGAATGGILAFRQGLRTAVRSSVQFAFLFALLEGAGIMINSTIPNIGSVPVDDPYVHHVETPVPDTGSMPVENDYIPEAGKSSVDGWFGGLFRK